MNIYLTKPFSIKEGKTLFEPVSEHESIFPVLIDKAKQDRRHYRVIGVGTRQNHVKWLYIEPEGLSATELQKHWRGELMNYFHAILNSSNGSAQVLISVLSKDQKKSYLRFLDTIPLDDVIIIDKVAKMKDLTLSYL